MLFHYSEDPTITRFRPHVAATSSESEPFVWAVDAAHAPSYWFPRDCPRACCWVGERLVSVAGAAVLGRPGARRSHAIEAAWVERVRACRLFVYELDPAPFEPRLADAGYWVARTGVVPIAVRPVGDLIAQHAEAGIELRVVQNLWPIFDAIMASGLEFSIIRKANAQPRAPSNL